MYKIHPLKAFSDNYIWVIEDYQSNLVAIVDPGDSKPVENYLEKNNKKLNYILATHHHFDHIGGIKNLKNKYKNIKIYDYNNLKENDSIVLFNSLKFKILEIPGHTLDHIAFYNKEYLFCGDTLFAAGCGRIFEGTKQQMFNSIQKIKNLKNLNINLKIYPAHEYTYHNLKFANFIKPNNKDILERLNNIKDLNITLPTSLDLELKTNLFLIASTVQNFGDLRDKKDEF